MKFRPYAYMYIYGDYLGTFNFKTGFISINQMGSMVLP